MADAFTGVGNLAYDTTAYNTLAWFALRPELYFDDCADVDSTPQTHRGASVQFDIVNDLAPQTATLSETVAPDSVALSDSQVLLALEEKGAVVKTTRLVRATSYIPLNPVVANAVGFNAGISIDELSRLILVAGTNVRYGGAATSRVTVAAGHIIVSDNVRRAYTDLTNASVRPVEGPFYRAYIHGDVAYDLKKETGDTGWRVVHNQSLPQAIINGDLGTYEGFRFVSTPRNVPFTDAGVGGTVDVYPTLFMGKQALAKAYSSGEGYGAMPWVGPGPITDPHWRIVPMGWYWLGKYGVFRQAALRRLETSSSIGAN